jgi:hypothetical protein
MNTNCLETDLDWLIYADYLDDQGINHFIREEEPSEPPWTWEYWEYIREFTGVTMSLVGSDVGFVDHYKIWASEVGSTFHDSVGSGGISPGNYIGPSV